MCKSCGSRPELSKEYPLTKIGVDTAENEPRSVSGYGVRGLGGKPTPPPPPAPPLWNQGSTDGREGHWRGAPEPSGAVVDP